MGKENFFNSICMKDEWLDKEFAGKWDVDTERGNPTRPEQLDILTTIISDSYEDGKHIIDLGFGSGQVEEMIFQRRPNAKVIGIDSSSVMIDLAHKRLSNSKNNYEAIQHELTELKSLKLLSKDFQFAIAVQALHHLPHEQKKEIFSWVYNILEKGGTFFILDRIAIDMDTLFKTYKSIWDRMERNAKLKSRKSFDQYVEKIKTKEDEPATVEQHLVWLREIGFVPACLHLYFDRILIGAQKI